MATCSSSGGGFGKGAAKGAAMTAGDSTIVARETPKEESKKDTYVPTIGEFQTALRDARETGSSSKAGKQFEAMLEDMPDSVAIKLVTDRSYDSGSWRTDSAGYTYIKTGGKWQEVSDISSKRRSLGSPISTKTFARDLITTVDDSSLGSTKIIPAKVQYKYLDE